MNNNVLNSILLKTKDFVYVYLPTAYVIKSEFARSAHGTNRAIPQMNKTGAQFLPLALWVGSTNQAENPSRQQRKVSGEEDAVGRVFHGDDHWVRQLSFILTGWQFL